MKIKLFIVLGLICTAFIVSGFMKIKSLILFNTQPITRANLLSDSKNFVSGNRIYYIFMTEKEMKNKYIRVQIFKMTDKAPWGGNEVVRTKDYRLMKDEKYYHTDYFTLYEKGRYVMQVFSMDNLQKPLALNDFYVK